MQDGSRIELRSPFLVYQLDTRVGLQAESWQNRLTGRTIALGSGSELEVDLGELEGPHRTPTWQAVGFLNSDISSSK